MPCDEIFSIMILIVHNPSTHRVAVLMHIGGAHKNRYLQTLIFKIFFIKSLFNYHHFAIGRTYYLLVVYCQLPGRDTKKRNQEKQEAECDKKNYPAQPRQVKADKIKRRKINKGKNECADSNRFISFFVNRHGIN